MYNVHIVDPFSMLLSTIPYSELESLLSQQRYFNLAVCFLIAFLSLSNILLNCAKDCFVGSGFFLPFLVALKLAFSDPSFSYFRQSLMLWVVRVLPCFLQRLQCFLVQVFLGTLTVDSEGSLSEWSIFRNHGGLDTWAVESAW
jgi:hypothetical protein